MIKYWIHIPAKGLALFFKKDEDKDCKDPWHIDENYKAKRFKWKGKRVFERSLPEQIRAEQTTDCYWFYCKIPAIPKEVWNVYQELKKQSRIKAAENNVEIETYKEKIEREKMDKWNKIKELKSKGLKHGEIAIALGCSVETIRRNLRAIEDYQSFKNKSLDTQPHTTKEDNIIYNPIDNDKKNKIPVEFDKITEL
jgi:hypothetical protein